jgi:hypothetical protein
MKMITLYDEDGKTILATIQDNQVTIHNTTEDFLGIHNYEIRPLYAIASIRLSQLHSTFEIDKSHQKMNFFDKLNDSEYILFQSTTGFYNNVEAATHAVNVALGR